MMYPSAEQIEKENNMQGKSNELLAHLSRPANKEQFADCLRNFRYLSTGRNINPAILANVDMFLDSYKDLSDEDYAQQCAVLQQDIFNNPETMNAMTIALLNLQSIEQKKDQLRNLSSERNRNKVKKESKNISDDIKEVDQNIQRRIQSQNIANEEERKRINELQRKLDSLEDKGIKFNILDIFILPLIFKYFEQEDRKSQLQNQIDKGEKQLEQSMKQLREWVKTQSLKEKDKRNALDTQTEIANNNLTKIKEKMYDIDDEDEEEKILLNENLDQFKGLNDSNFKDAKNQEKQQENKEKFNEMNNNYGNSFGYNNLSQDEEQKFQPRISMNKTFNSLESWEKTTKEPILNKRYNNNLLNISSMNNTINSQMPSQRQNLMNNNPQRYVSRIGNNNLINSKFYAPQPKPINYGRPLQNMSQYSKQKQTTKQALFV